MHEDRLGEIGNRPRPAHFFGAGSLKNDRSQDGLNEIGLTHGTLPFTSSGRFWLKTNALRWLRSISQDRDTLAVSLFREFRSCDYRMVMDLYTVTSLFLVVIILG